MCSVENTNFRSLTPVPLLLRGVKIGRGTYGKIYKYGEYALKKYTNYPVNELGTINFHCLREVAIMRLCQHENVIHAINYISTPDMYVIMSRMTNDLRQYINSTSAEIRTKHYSMIVKQILEGVRYLHANGIAHMDLKPENILMCETGALIKIRICDYTLSYHATMDCTDAECSRYYKSPELLLGVKTSFDDLKKCDVWSLGCTLFELWTSYFLFPGDNNNDQISRIFKQFGTPDPSSFKGRITIPAHLTKLIPQPLKIVARSYYSSFTIPAEYELMVKECLTMDMSQRPTIFKLTNTVEPTRESIIINRTRPPVSISEGAVSSRFIVKEWLLSLVIGFKLTLRVYHLAADIFDRASQHVENFKRDAQLYATASLLVANNYTTNISLTYEDVRNELYTVNDIQRVEWRIMNLMEFDLCYYVSYDALLLKTTIPEVLCLHALLVAASDASAVELSTLLVDEFDVWEKNTKEPPGVIIKNCVSFNEKYKPQILRFAKLISTLEINTATKLSKYFGGRCDKILIWIGLIDKDVDAIQWQIK